MQSTHLSPKFNNVDCTLRFDQQFVRPASAAGLYHYTVTANDIPDGANPVSIGFHYLAVDGNGNFLDSTGSGVPDYLEPVPTGLSEGVFRFRGAL